MMRNIRFLAVALVGMPLGVIAGFASAATVNFGQNLPSGPVPAGYAGFNWGSAVNDPFGGGYGLTDFSASISQFSKGQAFDLNAVDFQNFGSEAPGDGATASYSTVISGYLGTTLVSQVTENYGWSAGSFSGLNIDGVNRITFSTTAILGDTYCCDSHGHIVTTTTYDGPDPTFVSSLNVTTAAPELGSASAAACLTLLIGGLLVLRGAFGSCRVGNIGHANNARSHETVINVLLGTSRLP
jgi:hypothetical protein